MDVQLTHDPAWPWSSAYGMAALVGVALLLAGLTLWTYLGARGMSPLKITTMILLRLFALALVWFMIVRPSIAYHGDEKNASTLLVALDYSESMTINDEFNDQSRFESMTRLMKEHEGLMQYLRDDHKVSVIVYQFADEVKEWNRDGKPDGKRTDFGQMLQELNDKHRRERNLRGLFILSDGADNGLRFAPLTEATRFRGMPCPVSTFALGQPTTGDRQKDLVFTAITPEPTPVNVKGKLTVRGFLDAHGFENSTVNVQLLIDDKEIANQNETLRKASGNVVTFITDAPNTPGEIKVALRVEPMPGETSKANNEISTYVSVTKEGISVLFVDKMRMGDPQAICDSLASFPNIRLYTSWRRSDEGRDDFFQFDQRHYDVIILGDLTAKRMQAGNPQALNQILDLVREKGSGLLMIGGNDTFGNSDWNNTPLQQLSPVHLNIGGQVDELFAMEPTREGLAHYIMRLEDKNDENKLAWAKLPKLNGRTKLGVPKPGAAVLATTPAKEPLLVGQTVGKGRTLAFGCDTTHRWKRLGMEKKPKTKEGIELHARFWKQVIMWLAQQDLAEGNAWIKPDSRRLPAGSKLGFTVGLRGKGGVDIKDATYEVRVVGPKNFDAPVTTRRDKNEERGEFWRTDVPGEYRATVKAKGKDVDGTEAVGEATVRFVVFQDDTELARRAADHDFLNKLASAGGGKFYRADDLGRALKELSKQPAAQGKVKMTQLPDWRRNKLSGFLVSLFVLFALVLCMEWFLRRRWGMV